MLNTKAILFFGLKCFLLYLLLILLGTYTGLGKKYANSLRSQSAKMFSNNNYKVRFKKLNEEKFDTRIELTDKKKGIKSACSFNTWMAGFLPTALLFSLILATPIRSIKRTAIICFFALLLISVYIFLGIRIKIAVLHQQIAKAEKLFDNTFFDRMIDFINTAIIDPVSMIFLVPVILWGFLVFRKEDFVLMEN